MRPGRDSSLQVAPAVALHVLQTLPHACVSLPARNFVLKYDTNIPRQVGLAGSSAIITATLQCLLSFFGLGEETMAKPLQPAFVLSVEMEELGIQAGLQDEQPKVRTIIASPRARPLQLPISSFL